MDDVGKHLLVEQDIVAALGPLKSLDPPYRVQQIEPSLSLQEATSWLLLSHPGVAVCFDGGSAPEGNSIASPSFKEEGTWSTYFVASDSTGGRNARPVAYALAEHAGKLIHFTRTSPLGGNQRYHRGRLEAVSGVVQDRTVAVVRVYWRLRMLMREDPA